MFDDLLYELIRLIAGSFELIGVFIIALAGAKGAYLFVKSGFDFGNKVVPVELSKAMSLSLSFLLAAEILLTILVRNLEGLVVLIGMAGLRVGLHFVLYWDLKQSEQSEKSS